MHRKARSLIPASLTCAQCSKIKCSNAWQDDIIIQASSDCCIAKFKTSSDILPQWLVICICRLAVVQRQVHHITNVISNLSISSPVTLGAMKFYLSRSAPSFTSFTIYTIIPEFNFVQPLQVADTAEEIGSFFCSLYTSAATPMRCLLVPSRQLRLWVDLQSYQWLLKYFRSISSTALHASQNKSPYVSSCSNFPIKAHMPSQLLV